MNTSCDHLLVFCVQYNTAQPPTRFINLEIPDDSSADHVFLGEVTFMDGNESCGPAAPTTGIMNYSGLHACCKLLHSQWNNIM